MSARRVTWAFSCVAVLCSVLLAAPISLAAEQLVATKDWAGLTTGGVGPSSRYDVYVKASSGASCQIRSAINGNTYSVPASSGNYVMVRIDYYLDAPGWFDEAHVKVSWLGSPAGGEWQEMWTGGTLNAWDYVRTKAERPAGSSGQSFSYLVEAWGLDSGSRTCYASATGTFYFY